MRMQDYNTQQNLFENDITRRIQAQQNDLSRNSQLEENGINRADAAYQSERGRQMTAAAALPGLANSNMQAGQNLYNTGLAEQNQQQRNLDYLYQNWLDAKNEPERRLNILQNGIGTILGNGIGGNKSEPNPKYVLPWQNYLSIGGGIVGGIVGGPGGAMAGSGVGSAVGGLIK